METVTCVDIDGNSFEVNTDELAWRPSAYAIVIRDGKLLLALERGKYTLPGGGIDLGEMPEDAVVREVKEETGIDVRNPELLASRSELFAHHEEDKDYYNQTILLYYRCDFAGGELSTEWLPEADRPFHGTAEWVDLDKLDTIERLNRYDWRPIVREAI